MNPKLVVVAATVVLLGGGCSKADCITDLCAPLPTDTGPDTAADGAMDAAPDGGPCDRWAVVDACDGECPDPSALSFDVRTLATAAPPGLADPVTVAAHPTQPGRALVVSSDGWTAEVMARGDALDFGPAWDLGFGPLIGSSVSIAPDGSWAVAAAIDDTCVPGTLYFVDLVDTPGAVLRTMTVGIWPDHVAVSPDGRYVVTADEDQREVCKPASRHGGTITIIDVSAGVAEANVVQTITVDHAVDSEPEGLAIGRRGTVAVTVQETDDLLLFDLDDVPSATTRLIAMPPGSRPDGVSVNEALGLVAVALERTDGIAIVSSETDEIVHRRDLVPAGDVPADYNRDTTDTVEVHEPEEPFFFRYRGADFLALTVQESHAVLIYRVASDGSLTLDSVGPTGDYMTESGGTARSNIRPESMAVSSSAGVAFAVNEGEGSVTVLAGDESSYRTCE
jgi:DNA-binding beta-propeller fold protein YncE